MSTLKTNTLQNVAGSLSVPVDTVVQGSAKAWVNFNGTGTVAIRSAFNVTSITDNGVGLFVVNLTTPLTDANYSIIAQAGNGTGTIQAAGTTLSGAVPTSSAIPVLVDNGGGTLADREYVMLSVFR